MCHCSFQQRHVLSRRCRSILPQVSGLLVQWAAFQEAYEGCAGLPCKLLAKSSGFNGFWYVQSASCKANRESRHVHRDFECSLHLQELLAIRFSSLGAYLPMIKQLAQQIPANSGNGIACQTSRVLRSDLRTVLKSSKCLKAVIKND